MIGQINEVTIFPFENISFLLLCLLWLVQYLLDTEISLFIQIIGANKAKHIANNIKLISERDYENAVRHREYLQEKSRRERERMRAAREKRERIDEENQLDANNDLGSAYDSIKNNIQYKFGMIQFKIATKLPFILLTIIPVLILLVGLIMYSNHSGAMLVKYGTSVYSVIWGIITVIYFFYNNNLILVLITSIGLIATIIVTIMPTFEITDFINSSVLTLQLSYCGVIASK